MYDRTYMAILLKFIISTCFILALSACSNDGGDTETVAETVTEIPKFIQNISALTVANGELKASISINGATPMPLTVDLINGTSSISIPGLERIAHEITITFTFTDANNTETVILATATRTIDLANNDTLSFVSTDYEIDSHDDDNDGVSNLAEINSETDPTDDTSKPTGACILDDATSLIGSCTLG